MSVFKIPAIPVAGREWCVGANGDVEKRVHTFVIRPEGKKPREN
jgi:hypothetical protein